jgi:hypothetical protein
MVGNKSVTFLRSQIDFSSLGFFIVGFVIFAINFELVFNLKYQLDIFLTLCNLYVDDVEPVEIHEKELEHSSAQEKLDRELKELDKKLEQKEV